MSKLRFGPYVLSGILTIIPIWVSWLVFDFLWDKLSRVGMPWARMLAESFRRDAPAVADFLGQPWVDEALAAVLTILGLYLLGWAATRVIGGKLIQYFEKMILKVPVIGFVYGAVRKLIASMREKPAGGGERVVIVEFPHRDLKAIGLVMKTMTDVETGRALAAVYVPTAPNPTSGYLEIVPVDRLIATDWTVDQAMNFVMTVGAVSPDRVQFTRPGTPGIAVGGQPPSAEPAARVD
jgi:uncharacterized membrane protein